MAAERLEPCAGKLASTVLRGGIPSNGGVLLDNMKRIAASIMLKTGSVSNIVKKLSAMTSNIAK